MDITEKETLGETGSIFNIQRFCVNDGPGIRTCIFLKGCPLKCLWCSNPESQTNDFEIAFYPKRCINCFECENICASDAINVTEGIVSLDRNKCLGCGQCAEICPSNALQLIGMVRTANEIVEIVCHDKVFYGNEGGITLTGGEPLMQSDFSKEILRLAKNQNICTAIETCGYANWGELKKVIPYLDWVLYDVKHIDPQKHLHGTGVDNSRILENLKRLDFQKQNNLIIRIPVIPEFNTDKNSIQSFISFFSKLKNVQEINLLPYHSYGKGKYQALSRNYPMHEIQCDEELMADIAFALKILDIPIKIGA
jgi:pyruvate formate lyase activating enzyme